MEYMTVNEYALHVGKSVPLIYKRISEGNLKIERKFGRILIPVKKSKPKDK